MRRWKMISSCPEGVPVHTRLVDGYTIDGPVGVRNERILVKRGRLFWDRDTYVYYIPTEWCEL